MPVSVSVYDHTPYLVQSGQVVAAKTFKLKSLTAAVFNSSHATLLATGGTETTAGGGYPAGGILLTNVTIEISQASKSKFSADNVELEVTSGDVSGRFAIMYVDDLPDKPPLFFVDFGSLKTVSAGNKYPPIIWSQNGIMEVVSSSG